MLELVSKSVEKLAVAKDLPDLQSSLLSAVQDLGFVSYNLSLNKRRAVEFMEDPTLTNWSTGDLDSYANDLWAPRDPLLQKAAENGPAFLWHERDWRGTNHHEYSEYLQANGIRGGVTLPLSLAPDKLGAMTLLSVSDEALTNEALMAARIIGHFAVARTSAVTYTIPRHAPEPRGLQSLSDIQLKILDWVAKGKTNREISVIMEKSRRAIDYHMHEILGKLGVSSRTQAAAIYISRQS